jgi:16S rRNA (uracil1498-N3)-methyltransferase
MTQRFFVPPGAIAQDKVTFDAATAHQLRHVLRLRPDDQVVVLDDSGLEYDVTLELVGRDRAIGRIEAQREAGTEPRVDVTIYQGVLKGGHLEWVLQKGTELGVTRFVPMFTQHTVVRGRAAVEKRRARLERIVREAAEQSHRGRLPQLGAPLSFEEACEQSVASHDLSILPAVEAVDRDLRQALSTGPALARVAILIGPEGGFAAEEVAYARERGVCVVTLGARVLRAETAGIVVPALVLYTLGEMRAAEG